MKPHRLVLLAAMVGCAGLAALAPSAGCNGTGTTPICDFPDGANNPESGCGELVEAAASEDVTVADVAEEPAPKVDGNADASDATAPPGDSGGADSHEDTGDATEDHPSDAEKTKDAPEDAKKG